jgi:hypothetical protein
MRFRLFICLGSILLVLLGEAIGQTVCSGRVTGPKGKLLPVAHVSLLTADRATVIQIISVAQNGTYKLGVPRPGFWALRFSGVGYADQLVALYVQDKNPMTLNVSLGCHQYLPGEPELHVIGSFNLWSILTGVPLKKRGDGSFSADIPASTDSVSFRIRGYRDAEGAEGTRDAAYVLNREGTYDARIKTVGGIARVKVESALLDRSGAAAQMDFARATERTRRIGAVVRTWWDGERAYYAGQMAAALGRTPAGSEVPNWNVLTATLMRQKEAERDSVAHVVASLAYVSVALNARTKDDASVTNSMNLLSPTSPAWSLNPSALSYAVRHTSWSNSKRDDYIQSALKLHPDRAVRVAVAFNEFTIAFKADDDKQATRYYDLLTGEYADTPTGKMVLRDYPRPDPSRTAK